VTSQSLYACAKAFIVCGLLCTLSQIRGQVKMLEKLMDERAMLVKKQSQAIVDVAELRAKLRYLQTREGKEMVAHSFGYIARGEKFIRPLNTKVPNRQMLLELLPVDVDGEVAKVIHELRQQGKDKNNLSATALREMKTVRRVELKRERVKKWVRLATDTCWVGMHR
jgi:hypothetical protein